VLFKIAAFALWIIGLGRRYIRVILSKRFTL